MSEHGLTFRKVSLFQIICPRRVLTTSTSWTGLSGVLPRVYIFSDFGDVFFDLKKVDNLLELPKGRRDLQESHVTYCGRPSVPDLFLFDGLKKYLRVFSSRVNEPQSPSVEKSYKPRSRFTQPTEIGVRVYGRLLV